MSDKYSHCEPYEACQVKFITITDKLNAMHDDFKRLESRVTNGLTDRMNHVESKLNITERDRAERDMWKNRVMLIVIGVMISLSTTGIMWTVRHFAQHNISSQIQKP